MNLTPAHLLLVCPAAAVLLGLGGETGFGGLGSGGGGAWHCVQYMTARNSPARVHSRLLEAGCNVSGAPAA